LVPDLSTPSELEAGYRVMGMRFQALAGVDMKHGYRCRPWNAKRRPARPG